MTRLALFHQLTYSRWNCESLSTVANRAIHQSGIEKQHSYSNPLIRTFLDVVDLVEEEGQRLASIGKELAYHNRSHVADTINALGFLLSKTRVLNDEDRLLALITMAGHDLYHQGKPNEQLRITQEETTSRLLDENCLYLLSSNQRRRVVSWVLGTKPDVVQANHLAYRNSNKNRHLLTQIMINESDIAASLNSALSFDLTKSLLIERGKLNPLVEEVSQLHNAFTKSCYISSDAALSSF